MTLPIDSSDGWYSFRVRVKDASGAWSDYSEDCTFFIDRALPGNPTITGLPEVWEAGHTYDADADSWRG